MRGHATHLTVYFRIIIKGKYVEGYGHKGRDARDGVNLQQERINPLLCMGGDSDDRWLMIHETRKKSTDPYSPSVGAISPDDIPFVVEGSEEFPARCGRAQLNSQVKHWKRSTAGKLT